MPFAELIRHANRILPIVYFCRLQLLVWAFVLAIVALPVAVGLSMIVGGEFIWRNGHVLTSIAAALLVGAPAALFLLLGVNRMLSLSDANARELATCALAAAIGIVVFNLILDFQAASQGAYFCKMCAAGGACAGLVGGLLLSIKRNRDQQSYVAAIAERDRIARDFMQARQGDDRPRLRFDRAVGVKALVVLIAVLMIGSPLAWHESEKDWAANHGFLGGNAVSCERQPSLCEVYVALSRQDMARDADAAKRLIPQSIEALNRVERAFPGCSGARFFGAAVGILESITNEPDSRVVHQQYVLAKQRYEEAISELSRCTEL